MNNPYWSLQKKCMAAVLGITALSFAVTGCGEPDIQSMRPTVSKLAAEVLLVDGPSDWKANDLINAASAAGVDTFVRNIKAEDISTTLGEVVKTGQAGLCIVVYDGSIPQNVLSYLKPDTNVKFEFVSDGTNHLHGTNVQNVYVDPMLVGFLIGYGAGNLAAGMGQYSVGWLTSGTTSITRKEIEATLGGFYQANSKANIMPVTVGGMGVTLPHILISDHILDSVELQAVSQSGSVVFSLVNVPSGPTYAAWPTFIEENAVLQDFSTFANLNWKSGDRPIAQPQSIFANGQVLPQNVTQSMQTEESVLVGTPSLVQGAYTSIPNSLKLALQPIIALGS
jgi:hypothetical protein